MNKLILSAEEHLELDAAQTAEFYGVSRGKWYDYRRGDRKLPLYIQRSIEGHLQLSKSAIKHLIEMRIKQ